MKYINTHDGFLSNLFKGKNFDKIVLSKIEQFRDYDVCFELIQNVTSSISEWGTSVVKMSYKIDDFEISCLRGKKFSYLFKMNGKTLNVDNLLIIKLYNILSMIHFVTSYL